MLNLTPKAAAPADGAPGGMAQHLARIVALRDHITAERIGIAALVFVGLVILWTKNSSFFNFWTDRDMVRSANLLNEFQYMAAELSYGAASRVPGGALHYLWFIPTIVSSDPNLSYKFCILLCLLAAVPFYLAMRRYFGASAAIVSTAVLIASPVTFSTMMRLWNPSFQVPFLFLATAFLIRLVAGRETSAFKWMVAMLVIAMQMHVSTWLLMIALIPALIVAGPRIPLKEVLWSVALTVLLLAPYLVGETMTGWDNLRTMLASQGRGAVREFAPLDGFLFNFDNARDIWAWFAMTFGMTDNLPEPPLRTWFSWVHNLGYGLGALFLLVAIAHWLDWGKPLTRALGIEVDGAMGRTAFVAALPVILAFVYTSYSPQLELVIYGNSRYVMFAIPSLSVLAGLGASALMSAVSRTKVTQIVGGGVVAVAAGLPLASLTTSMRALDSTWSDAGRQFMGAFEIVAKDQKWSMDETISGMSLLRSFEAGENRWKFESIFAIGYELYRYKKVQPFSRTGRCAAYLYGGTEVHGANGMPEETLARSFEQPGLNLRIISQRAVARDRLVIYERPGKPCFTTITNRYVFSPEENHMFKRYGLVPLGKAEPAATPVAGQRAWIANLGSGIYVMVKLGRQDGKLRMELHSNQLRGDTYNGGFLDIGMINAPRLVLQGESGAPITLALDDGLVGGKGTFTPMQFGFDVPDGKYQVRFETEVYPPVPLGTWPVDFTTKTPISVVIDPAFVLGR